jgi:hypothetical protein
LLAILLALGVAAQDFSGVIEQLPKYCEGKESSVFLLAGRKSNRQPHDLTCEPHPNPATSHMKTIDAYSPSQNASRTTFRRALYALAVLSVAGCANQQPPPSYTLYPQWMGGKPLVIPGCRSVVKYYSSSFSFGGVEIPVPQLGGAAKVGSFDYKPQSLNTLYRSVAVMDQIRQQFCDNRVVTAQIGREEFQACNRRIEEQEAKINYMAMSATQGEAAVEEAVHKYGIPSSSSTAPPPKDNATKVADSKAVSGVKKKAAGPTNSKLPKSTSSLGPQPSLLAPAVNDYVNSVIQQTPTKTLLKMVRQPAPSISQPSETH